MNHGEDQEECAAGHVDHINGDGLDNRRSNLRVASVGENLRNRGANRTNTSGYKGVIRPAPGERRWRAKIHIQGRDIRLGSFATAEEAARAYDAAALRFHGPFAFQNFAQETHR